MPYPDSREDLILIVLGGLSILVSLLAVLGAAGLVWLLSP